MVFKINPDYYKVLLLVQVGKLVFLLILYLINGIGGKTPIYNIIYIIKVVI